MHLLRRVMWLLSGGLMMSQSAELAHNFTTDDSLLPANLSKTRALNIEDRQDVPGYQSSYYPYPPAPVYPPPSYGPPVELPMGSVRLEFAFDEIVLRCVAEEPFEHIVWLRYQCPQEFLYGGEGVHIADGSNVNEGDLYDVNIRGHDGTIISELLIKRPLNDASEGLYQCEAWPHIHGGYMSYGPFQTYNPPKSGVFIIGGDSLLEDCYHVSNAGTSLINKFGGINNKLSTNNNNGLRVTQNTFNFKPRRNVTESRIDSNSKQLRYNLNYVDNALYNVDGVNVTADFFRPSKNIPFNLMTLHQNNTKESTVKKFPKNLSSANLNFTGRNSDKFRATAPKLNTRNSKVFNFFSNST